MLWYTPAVFLASIIMADDVRYSTRPPDRNFAAAPARPTQRVVTPVPPSLFDDNATPERKNHHRLRRRHQRPVRYPQRSLLKSSARRFGRPTRIILLSVAGPATSSGRPIDDAPTPSRSSTAPMITPFDYRYDDERPRGGAPSPIHDKDDIQQSTAAGGVEYRERG